MSGNPFQHMHARGRDASKPLAEQIQTDDEHGIVTIFGTAYALDVLEEFAPPLGQTAGWFQVFRDERGVVQIRHATELPKDKP